MQLLEWHEVAGDAVDDDLLDAADSACDDCRAAGHGLQVDDAEGLVDRRATKDGGMRIELDGLVLGHHLLNPDDVLAAFLAHMLDRRFHFGENLFGIGSSGAEDYLRVRVDVLHRVHQVNDSLLTSDPADEEDDWLVRINAELFECGGLVGGVVLVDVDTVVDHGDLGRVDVEMLQDVVLGSLRYGDYGICQAERGTLDP